MKSIEFIIIIIILIIIIYYLQNIKKKEYFLDSIAKGINYDTQSKLRAFNLTFGIDDKKNNKKIEINNNDSIYDKNVKWELNSAIDNKNNEFNKINNLFQNFIDINLNKNINNKYNSLPLSFYVDISNNLRFNICNINIKPKQDMSSPLYSMVKYGFYTIDNTINKVYFILNINKITTCDIYILNIYEYLIQLNNFLKTDWFCIGRMIKVGYKRPEEYLSCRADNMRRRNISGYPINIHDQYAYRLINLKTDNINIRDDMLNVSTSYNIIDVSLNVLTRKINIFSGIEIYASILNGNCGLPNKTRVWPNPNDAPYFKVKSLEECKKKCDEKKCTHYEFDSVAVNCGLINLKERYHRGHIISAGTGDKLSEHSTKCYSNKIPNGIFTYTY